uniref:Uncharacterized protein n=1 Tax=Picea sitchensis TaxID=3332 RepID=A9NLZ5_PICSI|nr:unknown [Picea sitchensis]
MKAVGILLLVLVAMAASQVNVVDNNNPGGVNVVDNSDPNKGMDSAFYRPSAGGNSGIAEDSSFYRPSAPSQNYPPKQYPNPLARGGK